MDICNLYDDLVEEVERIREHKSYGDMRIIDGYMDLLSDIIDCNEKESLILMKKVKNVIDPTGRL